MDHEIYLALLELNEKYDYLYKSLVDQGLIKEEKEKKGKEGKKDDN